MPKLCDNKSVGVLFWTEEKLLMIERKKYNPGFAIPAGHQDGDDPERTAVKETKEEVGLNIEELEKKLVEKLPNPCKRENGTHHEWTIFEAVKWNGKVGASPDETKSYLWADHATLDTLTRRLEKFATETGIPLEKDKLPDLVRATNEILSWKEIPGLEPPMYFLFKKLGII